MATKVSPEGLPMKYVKSPMDVINAHFNMGNIGGEIMLGLFIKLHEYYEMYDQSSITGQQSLFPQSEFQDGELLIRLPMKELHINSKHYSRLADTLHEMSSKIVPCYETIDGRVVKTWRQFMVAGHDVDCVKSTRMEDASSITDIEKQTWKNGYKIKEIFIKISEVVANNYFKGGNYVLFLLNVYSSSKSSYTKVLYPYLSKFRNFRNEVELSYEELRRRMGMYEFDKRGNKVRTVPVKDDEGNPVYDEMGAQKTEQIKDELGMYPRYKDFVKRVLEPAKSELDDMFTKGMVDLKFEYEAIGKNGKKEFRGNPDKIWFKIIKNENLHLEQEEERSLSEMEIKIRACWKALLKDMGLERIDGIEPLTFNGFNQPIFRCVSEEVWNKFYTSPETAKYWKAHFSAGAVTQFETEEV